MKAASDSAAPLFDRYLIIDWSGANRPVKGANSIWIGAAKGANDGIRVDAPVNIQTRADAAEFISTQIEDALARNARLFIGLDFAFGYPEGAASYLAGEAHWRALWRVLADEVEDSPDNASNRFDLAGRWNRTRLPRPCYWGCPPGKAFAGLSPTKPKDLGDFAFRRVERACPPAKSVWQLSYAGAVGSQAMLGIARLAAIRARFAQNLSVWPFETEFASKLDAPVIMAEVYPSLFPVIPDAGEVIDAAQVRTLAQTFAALDASGRFHQLLDKPGGMTEEDTAAILTEEGWIVGAGHEDEALRIGL